MDYNRDRSRSPIISATLFRNRITRTRSRYRRKASRSFTNNGLQTGYNQNVPDYFFNTLVSRGSHRTTNGYKDFKDICRFSGESTLKDDDDGHLVMIPGQMIADRYKVGKLLGEGTFGRVVRCYDLKKGMSVALKVIKSVEKYTEAAMLEINVLKRLAEADPKGIFLCVQSLDWFEYKRHMCLSFELMGQSIFDFMKNNDFTAFPFGQVRHISHQLCTAVLFMHSCGLTHTDLKPENILFVNSDFDLQYSHSHGKPYKVVRSSSIRLIDFGSATFKHEHHTTIVATRHYRAIEIILELGWSYPCDVWAIGCIIFELYTAVTLFMTHDNLEHLAMMERILGRFPLWMIRRTRKQKYFYHDHLDWDVESSDGRYVHETVMPIHRYKTSDNQEHTDLFHLIRAMLTYDPQERIELSDAVRDPLFTSSSGQSYSSYSCENFSRSRSRLSSTRRHRYRR